MISIKFLIKSLAIAISLLGLAGTMCFLLYKTTNRTGILVFGMAVIWAMVPFLHFLFSRESKRHINSLPSHEHKVS